MIGFRDDTKDAILSEYVELFAVMTAIQSERFLSAVITSPFVTLGQQRELMEKCEGHSTHGGTSGTMRSATNEMDRSC